MDAPALYAQIYLCDVIYKLDMPYTYAIPPGLAAQAQPGRLAVVPFGGGNVPKTGVIVALSQESALAEIKPIADIPSADFLLTPSQLELCLYVKELCFCTFGEALRCVMPAGISLQVREYYEPAPGISLSDALYEKLNSASCDLLSFIATHEKVTARQLTAQFGKHARTGAAALVRAGYLVKKTDSSYRENQKISRYVRQLMPYEEVVSLSEEGSRRFTEKQILMLRTLAEYGGMLPLEELCQLADAGVGVAQSLCRKGAAEMAAVKDYRAPYKIEDIPPSEDFILTEEQDAAYRTLCGLYETGLPKAALLYGVTGSGKTNVILKTIDRVVEDGRQVIYLVPEIALTGQTIAIFAGRYRDRIAVLHSGLSVGEKTDAWRRIDSGEADIVIGTRSAVFAPVRHLGMIVMDEEQESSFKSDMTPKYHARDIARFRCAKTGSLMLLASATPSVESFYKAKTGKYTLISLTARYGGAHLPQVVLYDMKPEPALAGEKTGETVPSLLGTLLVGELRRNLENGEQSVLFMNRRGYHALLTCRSCGYVMQCPHCSVSMTYHKYGEGGRRSEKMACHYCGYTASPPKVCPACGGTHMVYLGSGTQTLMDELSLRFSGARVLRMDADTTAGKSAHEEILSAFRQGEADILVGTQMVTKGHDFPNVTLVGVVLADASLYLSDYRANERTFSLITQVLGRAGRGEKPGRAVVQTYSPEHPILRQAALQDYDGFYEEEIKLRRAAVFPPFCELACFLFAGENEAQVKNVAEAFGKQLDFYAKTRFSGVRLIVFGPFEASVYKLGGKFRLRYMIKCKNDKTTKDLLKTLFAEFSAGSDAVSVSLDINPSAL